jgi:GMP synthase-like glutamine amidotransferase
MKNKIHILQHVHFEGPAFIAEWAVKHQFKLTYTHLYKQERIPSPDSFDMLIIMGGPMGVYDSDKFDWLAEEVNFIQKCIAGGKPILGICLGAQIIANALGSKVYKGTEKEIGWYPIHFTRAEFPFSLPETQTVFHWHGDTFDLPEGSELLASSDAVINQGFVYKKNVIALQFHLEMNKESLHKMIDNAGHELQETGKYIMPESKIISESSNNLESTNQLMSSILTYLSDRIN